MKNKDKLSKPSSAGRVAGKGLSTKWSEYYTTGQKERKTASSESQEREVKELKAQAVRIPEIVQEQVRDQLGTTITAIVPTLIEGLQAWMAGGQQGPPPIPSFTGSNSHNAPALVSPAEAALVSPALALTLELNAPGCGKNTPTSTSAASGPPVTCTPVVGGASTLAELDAIAVTKPRPMTSSPCL